MPKSVKTSNHSIELLRADLENELGKKISIGFREEEIHFEPSF